MQTPAVRFIWDRRDSLHYVYDVDGIHPVRSYPINKKDGADTFVTEPSLLCEQTYSEAASTIKVQYSERN